jgi:hypothetical protein
LHSSPAICSRVFRILQESALDLGETGKFFREIEKAPENRKIPGQSSKISRNLASTSNNPADPGAILQIALQSGGSGFSAFRGVALTLSLPAC